MRNLANSLRAVWRDERGQTTLEWTLILVAFGLPMVYVFRTMLRILTVHYQMVTFLECLPYP